MKKFLTVIFILVAFMPLLAQQGIKYAADFVNITGNIDSTTFNSYTCLKINWEKAYDYKWFTGGNYCIYANFDTTTLASATFVDSDSLFMYIKGIGPNGNIVYNDSTFITPNSGTTGFDWYAETEYIWEFDLPPSRGVAIYIKQHCDTGAFYYSFYIPR